MYYVSKRIECAGAHNLKLNYESPCQRLHGHNWIITVHCKSKTLDENGMVVDFKKLKNIVQSRIDHQYVNETIPGINPTAENMARVLAKLISEVVFKQSGGCCYKVEVQESEGNIAVWEED